MCADLSTFGTAKSGDGENLFKIVSTHKSRLNNVELGIHEYVPIYFD